MPKNVNPDGGCYTLLCMTVRPYKGKDYGKLKPFGLSILVLGESSYNKVDPDGPLPPDWSEQIIGWVYKNQRDITITRAACVPYGGLQSFGKRQEFWRTAAFTNYVQDSAGSGPRQRPTPLKWDRGRRAFQEALEDLTPEFVLVLGKELWDHAFRQDERPGQVVSLQAEKRPYCVYPNGTGTSFVFGIRHPVSFGWSYRKWSPWVAAAMDTAKGLKAEFGRVLEH